MFQKSPNIKVLEGGSPTDSDKHLTREEEFPSGSFEDLVMEEARLRLVEMEVGSLREAAESISIPFPLGLDPIKDHSALARYIVAECYKRQGVSPLERGNRIYKLNKFLEERSRKRDTERSAVRKGGFEFLWSDFRTLFESLSDDQLIKVATDDGTVCEEAMLTPPIDRDRLIDRFVQRFRRSYPAGDMNEGGTAEYLASVKASVQRALSRK